MGKARPLGIKLKNGEIVISVGVDTVKWALERHVDSQPYNEKTGGFDQKWIVSDVLLFSKDVILEMSREEEDGSTPLIRFLDAMCVAALENGSIGADEAPLNTKAFVD